MVSMATSTNEQLAKKHMAETRLFKDHFYKVFSKYLQLLSNKIPFFNFPHYKSMENISCLGNQTKQIILIKRTNSIKYVQATMINISTKSQPHRAYSFLEDNFLSISSTFLFIFLFPWQAMKLSSRQKII